MVDRRSEQHSGPRRRLLPRSVRVRTTLTAAIVVGVALAIGGFVLVTALRDSMSSQLRTTTELRAEDVAKALETGRSPKDLADNDEDEMFVQVVDGEGNVVAASENVATHHQAVASTEPGDHVTIEDPTDDDGDDFLVVAEDAEVGDEDYTVLVGRSTALVQSSTRLVGGVLAAGIPILMFLVGATTWVIVGRTLAPVEAIRTEVDAISSDELHRRVPDPESRDEIARLAATMNRMLGRLEASQARQRRFISDASHELRSPVAAIRQHAEVALTHPDTTDVPTLAGVVLGEDLRVQQLVEDLLFLARSDEGQVPVNRRPVDLDDLVFAEARRLRGEAALRIDTSGVSAVRVDGDAPRLARVLRNLGDNARRHAQSTIRVTLRAEGDRAICRVEDDGAGIPEAERTRIFDRFVRLDEARTRDDGGSGLGLAIAAEIVRSHAGQITVTDSDLGGACFVMQLPAIAEGTTRRSVVGRPRIDRL